MRPLYLFSSTFSYRNAWHGIRAKFGEKSKNVGCTGINPTPCARILHPILHPKSSVNTRNLTPWCRKCRRFSKTFFVEGEREKAVLRSGSSKTSDFFGQKYGCFASKVRMFSSKKSDVFIFRKRPLYDTNAVFFQKFLFFRGTDIMSECTFSTRSLHEFPHGWSGSRIWSSR